MAHRDLLEASEFLDARLCIPKGCSNSETEVAARRGLLAAAIVYYAKSFTTNQGQEIADPKLIPEFQDDAGSTFHQRLMNLRNKIVAHSDATTVPAQIVNHNLSDMLIIATPISHPLDELDEARFADHVKNCIEALRSLLHNLSEELQSLPVALGSKVNLVIMEAGESES
jgi:hypothetical protein